MSGWSRWGIRRKLFAVMFLVLVLHMVVLLFMGSYLFEWFYTNSKITELKKSAQQIRDAYTQNSDDFYEQLGNIENQNMLVSLVVMDNEGNMQVIYHSRAAKDNRPPREWEQSSGTGRDQTVLEENSNTAPELPRENAEEWPRIHAPDESFLALLQERLNGVGEEFRIGAEGMQGSDKMNKGWKNAPMQDVLSLSTRLEETDNIYLFLQTPRGYIESTAQSAVRYTAVLSSILLLLGAMAVFLLAERLTKPLRQLQEAALKIARLDFSARCSVRGEDEISRLAQSINEMSGELEGAIGKLVTANEVLQSDLERQQQTDRMRRQFTANVSHDFKTPLTLMMSYAEALRESPDAQTAQEYCDIIVGEGERLSTMVGRLLELSKLENGAEQMEYSIFCLDEVIDEVIHSQKILSDKKQLQVTRGAAGGWIVHADYPKILRVFSNLLENAVKYTEEGGRISVDGLEVDGYCRVWVENTCEAIDPGQLDQLFDSFYRADASRALGQSYGLGLAIVKGIMDAHGRRCGAENASDGVRFWVELELAVFEDEDEELE